MKKFSFSCRRNLCPNFGKKQFTRACPVARTRQGLVSRLNQALSPVQTGDKKACPVATTRPLRQENFLSCELLIPKRFWRQENENFFICLSSFLLLFYCFSFFFPAEIATRERNCDSNLSLSPTFACRELGTRHPACLVFLVTPTS